MVNQIPFFTSAVLQSISYKSQATTNDPTPVTIAAVVLMAKTLVSIKKPFALK